ncbi:MAG: NAD(P)H-binding protein [Slackia piriformis]|uniref:NAD(P)H-binding protein n=2 Tax=Bacteria TaxID=2 RepID=A0A943YW66_9ACTN|nr:NAD(P)H-binding protein [Slackia piriformis]
METRGKVLILGATGGIGGETARRLIQKKWDVRALKRGLHGSERRGDIQWVGGDALDPEQVAAAAADCSAIVHAVHRTLIGMRKNGHDIAFACHRRPDVFRFVVCRTRKAFQNFFQLRLGIGGTHVDHAAVHGTARIDKRRLDHFARFALCATGLFLLGGNDGLCGFGKLLHVDRTHIAIDPGRIAQHLVVIAAVAERHDGFPAAAQRQLRIGGQRKRIALRDHAQHHAAVRAAVQNIVHIRVERKIVRAYAQLFRAVDFIENDPGDGVRDRRAVDIGVSYFTRDILLFVGKEEVGIAIAAHVVLANQARQRSRNAFAKRYLIGTDGIQHKNGDVVHRRLDVVDIANKIQGFQNLDVVQLKPRAVFRRALAAIDDTTDVMLQKLGKRVVETPERNKGVGAVIGDGLSRFLKARQHAALAA